MATTTNRPTRSGPVIGNTVRTIRRFTRKPVLLSEVGIGPRAGQAAKIPGLFTGIRRNHLLGLVYFDVDQHQGLYHQNWRAGRQPGSRRRLPRRGEGRAPERSQTPGRVRASLVWASGPGHPRRGARRQPGPASRVWSPSFAGRLHQREELVGLRDVPGEAAT